jgi:hypothetical protein
MATDWVMSFLPSWDRLVAQAGMSEVKVEEPKRPAVTVILFVV